MDGKLHLVFHATIAEVDATTAFTKQLANAFPGRLSVEVTSSLSKPLSDRALLVISTGLESLSQTDVTAIKNHRRSGGPVLIMIVDATKTHFSEHAEKMLNELGISNIKADPVISSVYTPGLYHPTHLLLTVSSFVCSSLLTKLEKMRTSSEAHDISVVYPNGTSFAVNSSLATVVLSSGDSAFPPNQPIAAALREDSNKKLGRCMIIGTSKMFADGFLTKFDNRPFFELILQYLLRHPDAPSLASATNMNESLLGGGEETVYIPDTQTVALNMRACLHAPDALPDDFTDLLDTVPSANPSILPQVSALYEKMGFSRSEPTLKLVNPSFEKPTPPLIPAVHFPVLPDPPGAPLLELFDLDTELASEQTRLNKLASKCTSDDVEFFIRQAGDLLNITGSPKEILYQVLVSTVNFKKGMVSNSK
ncbi:IFT complex B [Giardia duodenalis assemblage B]|uniref:IFT complex B n=2 Tax=Giardia intestinalis TaxID=5741 RepID=A0A132NZ85_GIAIN|nr:Intraflagellar transport protein 52 [Giardia intestinalis]KWX15386.1 IFT complex B [Giardia intestinalis assemblage B]